MEWMVLPLKRYAEFSGRSQRKEYWMYALFVLIVSVALSATEGVLGISDMIAGLFGPLSAALLVATAVPGIAVAVRRLHDIDRSGWWYFLMLPSYGTLGLGAATGNTALLVVGLIATVVVALVLLIFFVTDGTHGPNRFGADPKDPYDANTFA